MNGVTLTEKRVYDGRFGAMTKRFDANNLITEWTLDNFGRVALETRKDGAGARITKTATTRTHCVTNCPVGAVLAIQTDVTGQTDAVIAGASSRHYMDRVGNEIRSETVGFDPNSAAGNINPGSAIFVDKAYNNLGQVIAQTRPYYAGRIPVSVYFAYDVLGREVAETKKNATGAYKTSTTAYNHFTSTTTNEKGKQRTKTVNARGDLVQAVNAVGAGALTQSVMNYTYDVGGNLTSTSDNANNHITNSFDIRGRKIDTKDPDLSPGLGIWTYTYNGLGELLSYNGLGELLSQTDAKGQVATSAYDKLGRLVRRIDNLNAGANQDVTLFTYDTAANAKGKLAQIQRGTTEVAASAASPEQAFTFDSLSRPSTETRRIDGTPYTFTTTYDSASRIASIVYPTIQLSPTPQALTITNTYTVGAGYLKTVQNGATVLWQATAADAEGHSTALTLGSGIKTARVYNPYTGLVSTINSSSNNFATNDIQQEVYDFDDIGNLVKRTDARQTVLVGGTNEFLSESFTYDDDNRVMSSLVLGQSTKNYSYDALGNLITKAGIAGTLTYGGVGAGPHAVTAAGIWNYTYDANGNRLQQKIGSTTIGSIGYTSFNVPNHIDLNGSSVDFTYDANRNRIKETTNDGSSLLYLGGPARYEIQKSAGTPSTWTHTHYVTAGGEMVALHKVVGSWNGTTETKTGEFDQYFHTDHLGSIVAVTNSTKGS